MERKVGQSLLRIKCGRCGTLLYHGLRGLITVECSVCCHKGAKMRKSGVVWISPISPAWKRLLLLARLTIEGLLK